MSARISIYSILCVFLAIVGIIVYFELVGPLLTAISDGMPEPDWSISAADSRTYIRIAQNSNLMQELGERHFNLLGPVSLIWLFRENFMAISLFYVAVFLLAILSAAKSFHLPAGKLLFFSLLNPIIFVSFMTPNKDSLVVSALVFAACYGESHKLRFLFIALVCATFSRVEISAVILAMAVIIHLREKWVLLLLAIAALSLTYPLLPGVNYRLEALNSSDGLGLVAFLNALAYEYYLLAVVIIPKTLINVFDGLLTLPRLQGIDELLIYVPIVISALSIVLAVLAILRNPPRSDVGNLMILLVLFCVFVGLVPFVHHRYIVPVYPLLLIVLLSGQRDQAGASGAAVRSPDLQQAASTP